MSNIIETLIEQHTKQHIQFCKCPIQPSSAKYLTPQNHNLQPTIITQLMVIILQTTCCNNLTRIATADTNERVIHISRTHSASAGYYTFAPAHNKNAYTLRNISPVSGALTFECNIYGCCAYIPMNL